MIKVIRSRSSIEDLLRIWEYHTGHSFETADRIVAQINTRIDQLGVFPQSGERQPQYGENCRRLIEGKYLVFYDLCEDRVEILRVLHSARRIEDLGQ